MHSQLNLVNKNCSDKLKIRKGKRKKTQIDPILLKKNYQCIMIVNFHKVNEKEIYKSMADKIIGNSEKHFYVNMCKKSSYLEFLEEFTCFKNPKSRIENIEQFQFKYSFPKKI